jgi:hypothetical protein
MNIFELSPALFLLVLWTLPWKGYALWRASRKKHTFWFVVLLVLNTAALLDVAYIFYFSEKNKSRAKVKRQKFEKTESNIVHPDKKDDKIQ